jgi:hypothetical protein
MKSRLRKTTLATMKVALACQQPFAQKPLRSLQRAALRKILLVCEQDFANVVRMIEKEDILWAHPEIGDVSVFARHPLDKIDRVTAKGYKINAQKFAFRAGGKLGGYHGQSSSMMESDGCARHSSKDTPIFSPTTIRGQIAGAR